MLRGRETICLICCVSGNKKVQEGRYVDFKKNNHVISLVKGCSGKHNPIASKEQRGGGEEKNPIILHTKYTSVEENHRKLTCLLPE